MISSAQQMFSDGQSLSGTTAVASTNVIDLGATGTVVKGSTALTRDIGRGNPIRIVIRVNADATGTSPTLDAVLQVDTVENFASPTTVATATQLSDANAGDRMDIEYIPRGTDQRYLRLQYTQGGTTPVHVVDAFIVGGDDDASLGGVA